MYKYNREDIQNELEYSFISLFSRKLRIGVIGGGKAGIIKINHFVKNNCYVEALSKDFSSDILELSNSNHNLKLIHGELSDEFLKDKHIIIIALEDNETKKCIKDYCDKNYKIYIDSTDFKEGMAVIPVERNTKTMNVALNTKGGNPKGAVWAVDKISKVLREYDEYIDFTTKLRNKAKGIPKYKSEIIKFIFTDEFKKAFDKGEEINCIRNEFPEEVINKLF